MEELVAFENAVKKGMSMVDLEETLVVVTADHSHTMTINGYPKRGNDILGEFIYFFYNYLFIIRYENFIVLLNDHDQSL